MRKLSLLLVVVIVVSMLSMYGFATTANEDIRYISDLDGTKESGLLFDIDGENAGGIKVGGIEYDRGIIMHPDYNNIAGKVIYDIEGLGYDIFYAVGGKDASAGAQVGGDAGIRGTSVQMQVYVDDELKADSGVIAYPDVYEFKVDITGAKKLVLVILDGGDGIFCDATSWANAQLLKKDAQIPSAPTAVPATPKPTQDPTIKDRETVYISDMVFENYECYTNTVFLDCNMFEEELYIGSDYEYFEKGISFHAIPIGEAFVEIDITDMGFKTFTSYIGLNGTMSADVSMGTIIFRVYCDDELKYESQLMDYSTVGELISVDITDTKILRLAIDNAGDSMSGDLCAWGNACISKLTNVDDILATPAPTATPEVTQAPATNTPDISSAPSTAPTQQADNKKGGCGSSAAIAQILIVLGAALVIKKRK